MRRVAALLWLLAGPAFGQSACPGSIASWSFALPAPWQWAVYDLVTPPGNLLTVLYLNRTAETFVNVPQTVVTQYQQNRDQTEFFNRRIKPVYHELLLLEKTNCPLALSTGGLLWTK